MKSSVAAGETLEIELKEVELRVDRGGRVRRGQLLGYQWDGTAARAPVSGSIARIRYAPERETFVIVVADR